MYAGYNFDTATWQCIAPTSLAFQSLDVAETWGPGTDFQFGSVPAGTLVSNGNPIAWVHLNGSLLVASTGVENIGSVPANRYPAQTISLPCVLSGGAGDQPGFITIDSSNGQVNVSSFGGTSWQSVSAIFPYPVNGY